MFCAWTIEQRLLDRGVKKLSQVCGSRSEDTVMNGNLSHFYLVPAASAYHTQRHEETELRNVWLQSQKLNCFLTCTFSWDLLWVNFSGHECWYGCGRLTRFGLTDILIYKCKPTISKGIGYRSNYILFQNWAIEFMIVQLIWMNCIFICLGIGTIEFATQTHWHHQKMA